MVVRSFQTSHPKAEIDKRIMITPKRPSPMKTAIPRWSTTMPIIQTTRTRGTHIAMQYPLSIMIVNQLDSIASHG
jgi:hypothetical protein